ALRPTGETRLIRCGWCGAVTKPAEPCHACGHVEPEKPWVQRDQEVPEIRTDAAGRPALDARDVRKRLREARASLGPSATKAQIAEHLDVSVRTLGRWEQLAE
ncbi:MAG TPA: helix-turn-helix transcriptional regulator, partial [Candidatus Limnocylindrales bacterium]